MDVENYDLHQSITYDNKLRILKSNPVLEF